MNALSFMLKFTAGCILVWLTLAILSVIVSLLGYIWKPLFAIIGVYGLYLTVTGKYVGFSEKVSNIASKVIGAVKQ